MAIIGSVLDQTTDPRKRIQALQPLENPADPLAPTNVDQTGAVPQAKTVAPESPFGIPQAQAVNMAATPAETRDVTAITRSVDKPTETVQGQLSSFLSAGSPILERARAGAAQQANSRGLLNSSIAAGAGEAAAIDAATPIAQADANIYNQAAGQNLQYQNQAASQNSQQGTQVNMANASEQNKSSSQNAQLASQISQSNAENNLKLIMQQADNTTKTTLTNLELQNKNLLQTSGAAADLYKQGQAAIANILMNKDLDTPAKNAAIAQQVQLMQNGMSLMSGISGLSFKGPDGNQVAMDKLLDFTTSVQTRESPALASARSAYESAQAALGAAAGGGGSRRIKQARQDSARAEVARTKAIYDKLSAEAGTATA